VDPAAVADFRTAISEPKFAKYLIAYGNNDRMARRLYMWNIELSSAFWGPISVLEVMLRNAVHDAMRKGQNDAWWEQANLASHERDSLDTTIRKLREKYREEPTPDDVVGETSLGFWVGLIGGGIPRDPLYSYEVAFWQTRIKWAFPNLGAVSRKQLHDELQRIRALRNRIAHHEAIFNAPHEQLRDSIVSIAGYMSAEMAPLIAQSHRIDEVLAGKRASITDGTCRF